MAAATITGLGFIFGVSATLFIVANVNANAVGTALTQWAEQGHAPDGGVWDEYWSRATDPAASRFRSADAQEHLALLSEWRAHQLRLDLDARSQWYKAATAHYHEALQSRPLSASMWGQFAYSGLGSTSRVERIEAVDRALALGHGRDEIQKTALMTLLADSGVDAQRLAERVELLSAQRGSSASAIEILEQAALAVSPGDPRVDVVRNLVTGESGSTIVDGSDG